MYVIMKNKMKYLLSPLPPLLLQIRFLNLNYYLTYSISIPNDKEAKIQSTLDFHPTYNYKLTRFWPIHLRLEWDWQRRSKSSSVRAVFLRWVGRVALRFRFSSFIRAARPFFYPSMFF